MKRKPPIECPRCKEISLKHIDTIPAKGQPDIEEWWCDECHHMEFFTKAKKSGD